MITVVMLTVVIVTVVLVTVVMVTVVMVTVVMVTVVIVTVVIVTVIIVTVIMVTVLMVTVIIVTVVMVTVVIVTVIIVTVIMVTVLMVTVIIVTFIIATVFMKTVISVTVADCHGNNLNYILGDSTAKIILPKVSYLLLSQATIKIKSEFVIAMYFLLIIPVVLFVIVHCFYRKATLSPFPAPNKLTKDMMQVKIVNLAIAFNLYQYLYPFIKHCKKHSTLFQQKPKVWHADF